MSHLSTPHLPIRLGAEHSPGLRVWPSKLNQEHLREAGHAV